jgi:nitrous oxidase accessory protein
MVKPITYTILLSFVLFALKGMAKTILVGPGLQLKSVKQAITLAGHGDTVIVEKGWYKEGNIIVNKSIVLLGRGLPVLDGESRFEILSVKADNVVVSGFKIQNSGYNSLDDPGGIKVYESKQVTISHNQLYNNFFGIYLQYSRNCHITNNTIIAFGKEEQKIGNGVHCWKSDSLQIVANTIEGHRDGIYFEFVTHSVVWRNKAIGNVRYGLHFMSSNNDAYFSNYFKHNGAGVAVMFTKNIVMMNNTFEANWGDAAYGLLLKEISDGYMSGNKFINNTTAVFMDGTNRVKFEKNTIRSNGWGIKIQANCMDNQLTHNNFLGNTFDVTTNGTLTLNYFGFNFWDKYEGYDLNKDGVGDVSYRPLSLYTIIVENNPATMLLYRSFMVTLLDKSEKVLPNLTPENFIDNAPLMKPLPL